jgi:predicted DNA-binding ribbon-helix-helix protein
VGESQLVNRNVTARHGRTSMRLEPELWDALEEMCRRERLTLAQAIQTIDARGAPGSRTSAVRVRLLRYFRAAATEEGHRLAGHGAAKVAAMAG